MKRLLRSLVLAASLVGCGEPTSLLIEVDAPDIPGGTLDQLRFQVDGPDGSMADTTVDLPPSWPQTLAVRPGSAGDRAEVTIRVTGLSAGVRRVRRVVQARFPGSGQVTVRVSLSGACLDHLCADPFADCVAGSCAGATDGGVDAAVDSGVDAEVDSGTSLDSSVDAGPDSATDAGVDSATDAGADAASDASVDSAADACTATGPEVCDGADNDCNGQIDDGLPCPGSLLLSELTTGSNAGGTDEFVEIYNTRDFPISLSGVSIDYRSSSGATYSPRVTYGATDVIPAHGYFLAASTGYTGSTPPDATMRWSVGLSRTGGHVRIAVSGTEIDRFGWGSATAPEGTAFPASADNAGSYERKANASSTALSMESGVDVSAGNGYDTDDNASDWIRRATAQPQNRTSPPELP